MKNITFELIKHKKKSSTFFALATGEYEAAKLLVEEELYKESVVHLYFSAFYLAQSVLVDILKSNGHKTVATEFNKKYGKGDNLIPKRYVNFYNTIHTERNENNYHDTIVPKKTDVLKWLRLLDGLYNFIDKNLDKVTTLDIIKNIYEENIDTVKDFSYDLYCPKTYSHHNRISFWQPPFYLEVFTPNKLCTELKETLKRLHIRRNQDYVLGLNSKVNQYEDNHYLMIDIDCMDTDVESELKKYQGVLLKSGRGFHFIGSKVIIGKNNWIKVLKEIARNRTLKGKIDKDHIEISINRGYSTLRITNSIIKPNTPLFYKELK